MKEFSYVITVRIIVPWLQLLNLVIYSCCRKIRDEVNYIVQVLKILPFFIATIRV